MKKLALIAALIACAPAANAYTVELCRAKWDMASEVVRAKNGGVTRQSMEDMARQHGGFARGQIMQFIAMVYDETRTAPIGLIPGEVLHSCMEDV